MSEQSEERLVPIVEEDFAELLKKFRVKDDIAHNIAENISHTGGADVFEEPENLARRLTAWSTEVAPAKRKLIMEQWFAEKGIPVTSNILHRAGMTEKELDDRAADEVEEAVPVRYVYDTDSLQIRMTKKGEPGGTLAQAERLKELANPHKSGDQEPAFIVGEEGALHPNPNARLGAVELLAFEAIKKAEARGESPDPLEEMSRATENIQKYKDIFGGGKATPSEMPSWLENPAEFLKMIKGLSGESEAVIELRGTITTLQDQLHEKEVEEQKRMVLTLSQQVKDLADKIDAINTTPPQGKSELDILSEITKEGLNLLKSELPSVRSDIRSAVGSIELPSPKTPAERAERSKRYKTSVKHDEELVEVGKRLFLQQ